MLKTPTQIAKQYGFSVSYIRRLINEGVIKAKKIGAIYVIDTAKMKRLKRKRKPNK